MPIKQQSSWPFHPFLCRLAGEIDAAPAPLRIKMATKTIERCIRLAAKLANNYGMPLSLFEDLVSQEIKREKVGEIEKVTAPAPAPDAPSAPPLDDVMSTEMASPADILLASLTLSTKNQSN